MANHGVTADEPPSSSCGTALEAREWAEQTEDGLRLTDPAAVLDSWVDHYEAPAGKQLRLYAPLHETGLDRAAMQLEANGRVAFASFSAAAWLAPHGRHSTRYFYADSDALELLRETLQPSPGEKDGNIVIRVPNEDGVLDDVVTPEPDLVCTGPVQTCLDLSAAGDRERESADYHRAELLGALA